MLNVILVDDEYYVRNTLKENIPWAENGFTVIGDANNGKTAYQMILQMKPDIAIIDINMPGYNGLELISKLSEQQVACKYIILTGYDEFKYAQQSIHLGVKDYVLKPVNYNLFLESLNEIKAEIEEQSLLSIKISMLEQQNKEMILDYYYNDLVNCNLTTYSMNQYDDHLAKDLQLNYPAYSIAVVEFTHSPEKSILKALKQKVMDNLGREFLPFIACLDVKNRLFLIADAHDWEAYICFIHAVFRSIQNEQFLIHIGIGNPYYNFEQIYLSYNEACIALQNSSLHAQDIIIYKDIIANQDGFLLDPQTKNTLRTMILTGNVEEIKTTIHTIYNTLMRNKTFFDIIILKTLELLNLLIDVLSSQLSKPVSILNLDGSILDKLTEKRSIGEISSWITDLYCTTIHNLMSEKMNCCDTTISIEKYIKKNISEPDLSIAQISKDLYLNYSYICYCFKRDKNITINDYINQLRIEMAIDLFKAHYDNISFVAEKIGFNNAGYFSKRFKKAVGLTPSDYLKTIN